MTSITSLIWERRSCRKFTSEEVSASDIKELKRAALSAPTSKNCKSWQFVFVTDKSKIQALSQSKQAGAAFVEGAPLAVVVFGDPSKTDVWIEDASIASSYILLQSQALGLGATWVQLRERGKADGTKANDAVRPLLNVPEGLQALCIIAIGHPDEQHRPYSDDRLPWDQVHDETF